MLWCVYEVPFSKVLLIILPIFKHICYSVSHAEGNALLFGARLCVSPS